MSKKFASRVLNLSDTELEPETTYLIGTDPPDEDLTDYDDLPWWSLLRGGGGYNEFLEAASSVTSVIAKLCTLVISGFIVHAGGVALKGAREGSDDYAVGLSALVIGLLILLNTLTGLLGLWKYHRDDEEYDSGLLKWSQQGTLWLILLITAHGLGTHRYYEDTDETFNVLLTNPLIQVNRFWVEALDLICLVTLTLDTVALLLKDEDKNAIKIRPSLNICLFILLVAQSVFLTLVGLTVIPNDQENIDMLYKWYLIGCIATAFLEIIFCLIGLCKSDLLVGTWFLLILSIASIVFNIFLEKNDLSEYLDIASMVGMGTQVFAALATVCLLSMSIRNTHRITYDHLDDDVNL